jgi:hypothetical protein
MSRYTIMYMGIENECIKNENIVLKNIFKKIGLSNKNIVYILF